MTSVDNRLDDKNSEWFKDYSNDFRSHRKRQFFSIFYQAGEIITNPEVKSVLEFGSGRNVTKALVEHFGIRHVSVDQNPNFISDFNGDLGLFTSTETYDMVCAFQMLEHNPLEKIGGILEKFRDLSQKYVFISVPFSGRSGSFSIQTNIALLSFSLIRCFTWDRLRKIVRPTEKYQKLPPEKKYGPHWWEVGDKNFTLGDMNALLDRSGLKTVKRFHNEFYPYHLFYLLEKKV
ncbi:MAG: class I SAM-dependent methyltransferase [Magnetococcus sp. DMHC-1]|nr:hypothetical protein [Magnetococcales bacterium]